MAAANVLTEWARLTMSSFADAGVTDIVISPGSRSTPFIVAALRDKRLRCHSIIDERAAGFFALGHARATGRPAVVLCTSGTAPAHYYPALLEAELAFVPFIVLSADRPTELQSCAAPQTLDQVKLFGDHVRKFFDLGQPDSDEGALRACRRMVGQAVFLATGPTAGPVHLNACARKPLEPTLPSSDEDRMVREKVDRLLATPITRAFASSRAPRAGAVAIVAEHLSRAERGVIVCGPAAIAQRDARKAIFALAARTGFPLLAEATSQLRFAEVPDDVFAADAFDVFLRLPELRKTLRPDVVVQFGSPPVSDAFSTFAGQAGVERVVIAADGWNDPDSNATWMLFGDPAESAAALTERLAARPATSATSASSEWLTAFRSANERAWSSVDNVLARDAGTPWSEGVIVQTVVAALPRASHLILGNSLPVRMIDLYCRHQLASLAVASQRGVSGIDGYLASTAAYADALQQPTTLLLGDVTFLHDLASLGIAERAGARTSVAIVVIQNGGGRIFEQLPLAAVPGLEQEIMQHVTTPHALDISHLARFYGVPFVRVSDETTLRAALEHAHAQPGCTLIEAIAPDHDAAPRLRRVVQHLESVVASAGALR
jgi:2-succinyl-5-enolpyruvyl-6-hydroxy-3-cyclohexene-1-carboxylate synthase